MAFIEKRGQLGVGKEESSRYDGDTVRRGKGDHERNGAVAVRTTGTGGGGAGRERSGRDGGTGRVLREEGPGW